ncbi:MAG: CHRD domain-containing protein, partial [Thermoanaerobaculia bacterium]
EPSSLAAPGVMTHDPALDEPFDLPDFMLDSLANGGEPVSFTVPGGVLTEGDVVGFHFIGTVAGISGSSSWASDMCLMIEAPDGTTYVVGGFSGTSLPGCFNAASEEGNPWDFQGSQSTDDGTYESEHDDVFDPALEDEGDWTFTFVNDWDSTGAATMDWTDVTLTLHKTGDGGGEVCDDVTEIPWLSADPQAGTTAPGGSEPVNVTVDATDLDPGTFEAALCVATNDPNAPVVPVAVTLSVIGGGDDPVIDVDPDSLSSTLPEGGTETHDLTISNLGGGTLEWAVTEESPATGRVVPSIWSPLTPTRDELSAGGPFTAGQRAATGGRAAADAASAVRGRLRSLPVINPANGVVDCDAEPGIIIHDDGTVENGYSGNPTVVSQVIFADRFTPSAYPATFSAVCVAYLTLSGGPGSLDLDIVVFDDDGSGGTPGTELGSMAVTVTDIPVFPNATPVWASFDISSLGIEVTAGSVFIGARWAPPSPTNVFIASDESTTNPPGFAGGYWWNDNANAWAPIQSAFPSYRSLVVRAVEGAGGPSDCTLPSWVSVDPMSGSVPGGESQVAAVTFDATGLPEGEHTANLCIESNDPVTPLVVVPLTLTVTGGGNVACFEAELDGDQETPPVPTDHTGTGVFSYDFDTQELTWEVTHDIDLAEVVGAHIHLGAVGKPGPIVIPMDHTVNPIVGSATLTPDMEMDLTNELYYVNVHTNAYPGGEIRGQILSCDEEPVEGSLTTLFASNNGFAGNTFDIEPFVPLEITGFDVNVAANSDQTITIYWKEGTAAGFDSDPTAWTALGSDVVTPAGQDQPTHAKLGGLQLQPGNVYGIYVDLESYELGVSALRYTNGPPTVFSNDELNHLSLTTLIGKASPAFEGQTFADRMWNGTVYYTLSQAEE